MAFSLQNFDGSTKSVRDAAFDNQPRTGILVEDAPHALVDDHGHSYVGRFDGHDVKLSESGNTSGTHRATWILGTAPVRIPGGPPLDSRFVFTFFDHGQTEQRLNALWQFNGSSEEAVAAFAAAGFSQSQFDARRDGRIHLRSAGTRFTGRGSAHAIVYAEGIAGRTEGEIHVGEHNPLRGFGIGFLLHQWEIRR